MNQNKSKFICWYMDADIQNSLAKSDQQLVLNFLK